MPQQIRWIIVDSISARAFQLFAAITARKQSDTQGARPPCREQIPDAVADHNRIGDIDAEFLSRGEKEIRIGLRMLDHVARDDRHFGVDAKETKRKVRALESSASGDGPGNIRRSQIRQQLRRARQWPHLRRVLLKRFAVYLVYSLSLFGRNLSPDLTSQSVHEESAAHADLAVNAPNGEMNPAGLERLTPREHVLIDAIDQRSVEIEKKGLSSWSCVLIIGHLLILPLAEMRIRTSMKILFASVLSISALLVAGTRSNAQSAAPMLFDDFSYTDRQQMKQHGWIIRTEAGWPGVPGATWLEQNVWTMKDANRANNWIVRMTSTTDGTAENTTQTQICHERKYFEGTYAARVRFSPDSASQGDQIVQSFYTISPLKAPMDPDYSELDWEYLPNGGWGIDGPTLYATTWETFSPEPNWKKDNIFKTTNGSQAGWHTLVTQVMDQKVRYFLDGELFVEHGGNYYPEDTMSINFNLWFIRDGMTKSNTKRAYQEDIDWVFFQANTALTPKQVEATVAALRKKSVKFRDTVPSKNLKSPCNF